MEARLSGLVEIGRLEHALRRSDDERAGVLGVSEDEGGSGSKRDGRKRSERSDIVDVDHRIRQRVTLSARGGGY